MNAKVAGTLLLFCLIAPLVATFACLHYQKAMVRKEVKHTIIAGIDKNELVLLRFTEEESKTRLRWEHSKEFEFLGQMYDVVEKEIKGDTTYYWCWLDNKETKLNKQLDGLVAKILGNNPYKKEKQEKLVEFIKNLFYIGHPEISVFSIQTKQNFLTYDESYSSVFLTPPFPPPRMS